MLRAAPVFGSVRRNTGFLLHTLELGSQPVISMWLQISLGRYFEVKTQWLGPKPLDEADLHEHHEF